MSYDILHTFSNISEVQMFGISRWLVQGKYNTFIEIFASLNVTKK